MLDLGDTISIQTSCGATCSVSSLGAGMVAIVPDESDGFIVAIVDTYCFCYAVIAYGDVLRQVSTDEITMVQPTDVKNAAAVCRKFNTKEEALKALSGA
jgi:hypothetical protein